MHVEKAARGNRVYKNVYSFLLFTSFFALVQKYSGGRAGAFRNVVVRKHMTHPFQLEQNGVTHP